LATQDIWQRTVDLSNRVFAVTSDIDLPHGDPWPTVVTLFLAQANERLHSVKVLSDSDNDHWDSAVILTRSLFELAVNLAYIEKDANGRLTQYLRHGGIPLTHEEAEQLQQEIEQNPQPAVLGIVPARAWKKLQKMCKDLGDGWVREYEMFYRYSSVPTHAGAFTLGKTLIQLLQQSPPTAQQRAMVLITALALHLRVGEIGAKTFPREINLENVKTLRKERQDLGQSLSTHQPPRPPPPPPPQLVFGQQLFSLGTRSSRRRFEYCPRYRSTTAHLVSS